MIFLLHAACEENTQTNYDILTKAKAKTSTPAHTPAEHRPKGKLKQPPTTRKVLVAMSRQFILLTCNTDCAHQLTEDWLVNAGRSRA